ncbi:MAG: right-handed parallel beta-helix repeat-containing protein [Phycisphaerae bacterium]|nr:right-handed parallel beta-helix repeat-containing protein [Phycisphaerae bacterium]
MRGTRFLKRASGECQFSEKRGIITKKLATVFLVGLCLFDICLAGLPTIPKKERKAKMCPAAPVIKKPVVETGRKQRRFRPAFKKSLVRGRSSSEKLALEDTLTTIEIPAGAVINTNTVWDCDVHLNGKVYVEGAMLIIKPDVTVRNCAYGGIIVRNAGVINAVGTPDSMVSFVSDAQSYHDDYEFAIKIEGSASSMCKINYCYMLCAEKGIWIRNNRLDEPIMDNEIEWCYEGIYQEGPELTDVFNNLLIDCYYIGIEIYMADANGNASSETIIAIEHNTVVGSFYGGLGQDCGIGVHGVADSNEVGTAFMANNLIAGSYYYAIIQGGGWVAEGERYNHGYYANSAIENPGNPFDDVNSQMLTEDPFVYGYAQYPFFLEQDCALIDAGSKYIDETHSTGSGQASLIGKATTVDGVPDSNITDIGFHYINWQFSNAGDTILTADLDNDYKVDFGDIMLLADYWLYDYGDNQKCYSWDFDDSGVVDYNELAVIGDYWLTYFDLYDYAEFAQYWLCSLDDRFWGDIPDISGDGFVNLEDFALLASQWELNCEPMLPNIVPSFDQDPNNLSGYVHMSIDVSDQRTYKVFALIDGLLQREFFIEMEDENPFIGIHTENFTNSTHEIKIVSMDVDGRVVSSQTNEVVFNNELSHVAMEEGYQLDKPYCFYAFGLSGTDYTVEVNDGFDGTTVYSGDFTGNIQAIIPGEVFSEDHLIYDMNVSSPEVFLLMANGDGFDRITASSSSRSGKMSASVTKKVDYDPDSTARMIVSVGSEDVAMYCKEVINAVVTKGGGRIGTNYVIPLSWRKSTWDNVKRWLQLQDVKIWVHFGHGCYGYESKWNQIIEFNGEKVSAFNSWWYPHSIEELGFMENPKLNFVYFHTCEGGATSQFAEALGILPINGFPGDKAFISWTDEVPFRDSITVLLQSYNPYTKALWEGLGAWGENLHDAKERASDATPAVGQEISTKLRDYGVSDVGFGDQYIWFRYPDITSGQ